MHMDLHDKTGQEFLQNLSPYTIFFRHMLCNSTMRVGLLMEGEEMLVLQIRLKVSLVLFGDVLVLVLGTARHGMLSDTPTD